MDKINNIGLSRELTSCYDFHGFTEQEVWSRIAQKINIIIEHFNYIDKKVDNEKANNKTKFDYLLGEGLSEQVAKVLLNKITDGTIGELINGSLLTEINNKVDNYKNETDNTVDGFKTETTNIVEQFKNETTNKIDTFTATYGEQVEYNSKKINPFYIAYELDNTGDTDVTSQLQQILNDNETVMLPSGVYQISKIRLNSNNYLYGENKDTTILKGNSSKYMLETNDKAYNVKIAKLTIDGNNIGGGIHFVATNNDDMIQFDIKNSIDNVMMMNTKFNAILLDNSCRECRINYVNCYYGEKGIIIEGTDNFISNCTAGAMKSTGFSFYSNNKVNFIKAFMCNETDEGSAVIVKGYGVNISNLCVQQNYNNGLYVNGDNCYIDIVCDSQGYNALYKNAYGIYVNGNYNNITGSVIDGRLGGSMKAGLFIDVGAFYNNINITFRVVDTKTLPSTCDMYKFFINKNINNIIINGETINSINNIEFTLLKDYITEDNTTFKTDATGGYNINNNDIEITLNDFASINGGYGSSLRTDINTTDKKYLILLTSIKMQSDRDLNIVRSSIQQQLYNGGLTTNYLLYYKNTCAVLNNFIDLFIVIDVNKVKNENNNNLKIWLALMKYTTDNQTSTTKAIFRNTRFYFTD